MTRARRAGRWAIADAAWCVRGWCCCCCCCCSEVIVDETEAEAKGEFWVRKERDGGLFEEGELLRMERREVRSAALRVCCARIARLRDLVACSFRRSWRMDSGVGAEAGVGRMRFYMKRGEWVSDSQLVEPPSPKMLASIPSPSGVPLSPDMQQPKKSKHKHQKNTTPSRTS